MSDYDDDDYSNQYGWEINDNSDREDDYYEDGYSNWEEENMNDALVMHGRQSQEYISTSKAYRHYGGSTLSPYAYVRYKVLTPRQSPLNQDSVLNGKNILKWILEDTVGVSALAEIIVSYVEESQLEDVFDVYKELVVIHTSTL
jgi:hypothetical protein